MKRIAAIILLAIGLSATSSAQSGWPYVNTTETTWQAWTAAWKPILAWHSGLVERAYMITNRPVMPNTAQTFSVITNVAHTVTGPYTNDNAVWYFTNAIAAWGSVTVSNLTPKAYAITRDGVSGVATAYPVLTATMLAAMDTYQDNLYTNFCDTNAFYNPSFGGGDSYNYWMDRLADATPGTNYAIWLVFGGPETPMSRAHVFSDKGLGKLENTGTNGMGWITNGIALWSAPFNGFSGGEFRLGSANRETAYLAAGFPLTNGMNLNGLYQWAEPNPWNDGWFEGETLAGFYKGKVTPFVDPDPPYYDRTNVAFFDPNPAQRLLVGSPSSYDLAWYYLFNGYTAYIDGFGLSRYATNWTEWANGSGATTNRVSGRVVETNAWNFRRGGSWSKNDYVYPDYAPALASTWSVTNAGCVLRYTRATNTLTWDPVTVTVAGQVFNSQTNGPMGFYSTTDVVSVTGQVTVVSPWFSGVSNMIVQGSGQTGDAITVWATNRELYTLSAAQWGTINKRAIDERVAALKTLRWRAKSPAVLSSVTTVKWQGLANSMATPEAAYNYATSHMVQGWTDVGPNPEPSATEAHYGAVGVTPRFGGVWDAEVVVWRQYYTYTVTGLSTARLHAVDVVMESRECPNNDVGYPETYYCDIPGFVSATRAFVFTNSPPATNSTFTYAIRSVNTNYPGPHEFPPFTFTLDPYYAVMGFESPNVQFVIQWAPDY